MTTIEPTTDPQRAEPEHAGEGEAEEHLTYEEHSDREYFVIAVVLALLTAMEVAASYLDLGPLFIPLLIVLMVIKFSLVVLFFMHLRHDARIFHFLFWSGVSLAVVVYVVALATFEFFLSS
jgi:cytochrome c oxidase subunit IV